MRRVFQFFATIAAALVFCLLQGFLLAPLAAAAASEAAATGHPAGPSELLMLLGIGLSVGATITGSIRIGRQVFGPGQWEAFLRAARESGLKPSSLKRLIDGGQIELEEEDGSPNELLASEEGETDPLAGIDFTTTGIRDKALEKDLVAADFEGYEPSANSGFSSDDVDTVASAKEE